ncbi:MAG: NfeD family protein [Actinobacteria bacterium]|nr:NfeD family protein [Actinomycetota bacterium]
MDKTITLVAEIERYWQETGVPRSAGADMRLELEQHLIEAVADGHSVEDVIGPDQAQFAEDWAAAHRKRRATTATWQEVQSGTAKRNRKNRRDLTLFGVGTVVVVAAVAVIGQGVNDMDNEVWRWLWTIFAIVMGIGEIFTAGFFLLPFAIGAGAAAVLAWIDSPVLAQWLVFFGLSVFSLAYLRKFMKSQDEGEQSRVGANRWVGEVGTVLNDIDPVTEAGMVTVLREKWRATAAQPITAGERIIVTEIQGTRLTVERLEDEQ